MDKLYSIKIQNAFLAVIILVALNSCAIQFIAAYDAVTDEQVFFIQEKVLIQFVEWRRAIEPIDKYMEFYDEIDAKLTVLIERNKQIPKSEFIIGKLELMRVNLVVEMKQLHRDNKLDVEVINQIQPDIMAQFNAIQKFQMALKRNDKTNKNL